MQQLLRARSALTSSRDSIALSHPRCPAGWTATNVAGPAPLWVTSTATPDSARRTALCRRSGCRQRQGPRHTRHFYCFRCMRSASAILTTWNVTQATSTMAAVLEVSSPNINGGAFTDITDPAVGGNFVTGGYDGVISNCCGNPLAGRMAWGGDSGGYINAVANLGPNVVGQTIKLRFRMGSDSSVNMPWLVHRQLGGAGHRLSVAKRCLAARSTVEPAPSILIYPLMPVSCLGAVGIEDRNGAGSYQIVATFTGPVTVGSVAVTTGTGAAMCGTASGDVSPSILLE